MFRDAAGGLGRRRGPAHRPGGEVGGPRSLARLVAAAQRPLLLRAHPRALTPTGREGGRESIGAPRGGRPVQRSKKLEEFSWAAHISPPLLTGAPDSSRQQSGRVPLVFPRRLAENRFVLGPTSGAT